MASVLRTTSSEGFPPEFHCPLCYDVMVDPVVDNNGNTYERSAIEDWINRNGTSPLTRAVLTLADLRPNRTLRDMIESAHKQRAADLAAQQGESKSQSSETKYDGTDEASLEVTTRGIQGEDWALISVKCPEGAQTKTPVDICVVIDTSGSMCSEAKMQSVGGVSESHGLSILDVVKHATTTIIESLGKEDRLSIVAYSSQAKSVLPLTAMHAGGKALAKSALSTLQPSGSTNLWDGLKMGLDLLASDSDPKRLTSCFILTDGCPNIVPPRGHLPMLRRYKDSHSDFSCTINTYGFGYNLDSSLLDDLAREGQGSYSFIPDCGFVGTIFTNALANLCSTMGKKVRLTLEPLGSGVTFQVERLKSNGEENDNDEDDDNTIGKRRSGTFGGHPCTRASWGWSLDLGTLRYGQTKDIVVHLSGVADTSAPTVRATLSYEHVGASKAQEDLKSLKKSLETDSITTTDPATFEADLMYHTCRLEAVDTIYAAHEAYKTGNGAEAVRLVSELATRFQNVSNFPTDKKGRALIKDITGQITEAVSKDEYYTKWGQHYLPSLAGAHLLQLCYNFKDPGVQHYGGELFSTLRDSMDELFNKLPPPKPSRRIVASGNRNSRGGGGASASATPALQSMASYNCSSAPCFPGDALVLCANGESRRMDTLSRGDLVATGMSDATGQYGEIDIVVCTNCKDEKQDLVELKKSGLRVTQWHPIRIKNQWIFPNALVENGQGVLMKNASCKSIYSILLKKSTHQKDQETNIDTQNNAQNNNISLSTSTVAPPTSASMIINGVECITLGHGIMNDEVASHPFYGTDLVRTNLTELLNEKNNGVVFLTGGSCVKRSKSTGLVNSLYVVAE